VSGSVADDQNPYALQAGTAVGPYLIEAVLGSGGFGITYLARHQTLNKQFALKEYFPYQFCMRDSTRVVPGATAAREYRWGLDRFVNEAQALAKFNHPAIVDVSDIFTLNNTAYMVLAYEQAPSLDRWLKALGRPVQQSELDQLLPPLLDALELVHKAGMLHRDIAPDNILVRSDGTPVLIDFGAAREDVRHPGVPVTAVIKPGYSPPEQYEHDASRQGPWSDIYSFGATLYYAVVGVLPATAEDRFDGRPRTEAAKRARDSYRPEFLAAIDWAMAFDPAARPQSIAEWRDRLFSATRIISPPPTTPSQPSMDLKPRRPASFPWKSASAGAIVLVVAAAVAALWPCLLFGLHCPAPDARAARSDRGPFALEIVVPKQSYAIGDNLTFKVRSDKDCYFMVYTVSPTGEIERHDPAQNPMFMGSPVLKAGEWRQLPLQGFATVKPPAGTFELGAVCSREPLSTVGLSDGELIAPARGGRRSFSFALESAAKNKDVASARISYEVHQ
jgi:hypothetical protein